FELLLQQLRTGRGVVDVLDEMREHSGEMRVRGHGEAGAQHDRCERDDYPTLLHRSPVPIALWLARPPPINASTGPVRRTMPMTSMGDFSWPDMNGTSRAIASWITSPRYRKTAPARIDEKRPSRKASIRNWARMPHGPTPTQR